MAMIAMSTAVHMENSRVVFHYDSPNTSSGEEERWPPPGRRRRHPAGSSRYYVRPFSEFFPDPRICESDQTIHLNSTKSTAEPRGLISVSSGLAFVNIPEECEKPVFIVGHAGCACMGDGVRMVSSIATSGFYSGPDSLPQSPSPNHYFDQKHNIYGHEPDGCFFDRCDSLDSNSKYCNETCSLMCRPTGGIAQTARLSAGDEV
ncbi:hypothetical protein AAHC03_01772 [Spirometra sp. Aus1]